MSSDVKLLLALCCKENHFQLAADLYSTIPNITIYILKHSLQTQSIFMEGT